MDVEAWRKYLAFSVITALAPNLLLVLLILRTISRPLQRITLAAVQVTNGEYGTMVDLKKSNDEIGLLADSFNEMSGKMAADIEQLRRLNDQLVRSEKLAAMGTLAAGVAHEVNNPLASISSLIQMLQKEDDIGEDSKEKLKLISSQISRISRVTKDMTDLARTQPTPRRSIELNSVVLSSLRLARFDEAFRKIDVEIDLGTDLPPIEADADQIQQVFLNLFLNARDAMPEGGRLTIHSAEVRRDCVVTITDSGSGIDHRSVNKIFDPFFTTKPAGSGTGLGLSICYGIVTAHGGTIEALAAEPSGTKFVVRLPFEGSETEPKLAN
jgi:signal transduction histidine kinase